MFKDWVSFSSFDEVSDESSLSEVDIFIIRVEFLVQELDIYEIGYVSIPITFSVEESIIDIVTYLNSFQKKYILVNNFNYYDLEIMD